MAAMISASLREGPGSATRTQRRALLPSLKKVWRTREPARRAGATCQRRVENARTVAERLVSHEPSMRLENRSTRVGKIFRKLRIRGGHESALLFDAILLPTGTETEKKKPDPRARDRNRRSEKKRKNTDQSRPKRDSAEANAELSRWGPGAFRENVERVVIVIHHRKKNPCAPWRLAKLDHAPLIFCGKLDRCPRGTRRNIRAARRTCCSDARSLPSRARKAFTSKAPSFLCSGCVQWCVMRVATTPGPRNCVVL